MPRAYIKSLTCSPGRIFYHYSYEGGGSVEIEILPDQRVTRIREDFPEEGGRREWVEVTFNVSERLILQELGYQEAVKSASLWNMLDRL